MSNYKIDVSSELMENYLQADTLGPEEKFLALQTNAGTSLLFSIGTDGAGAEKTFYVTSEAPKSKHGWVRRDLSSAQIKSALPNGGSCTNFAAAQSAHDGTATIQLAMVVNDRRQDHLYLSLGNSDADTSWTDAPKWVACPFNAVDADGKALPVPNPFHISNLFISEATDKEYIVVDVVYDPNSPVPLVSRYYIDATTSPDKPVWHAHALNATIEAEKYMTCLGRRAPHGHLEEKHPVDGLYTAGKISGSAAFIYTPLYSIFDRSADPSSTLLQLTSDPGIFPDAIATVRNADNTSDLYATHGGCLYYFSSAKQTGTDTAQKLVENPLFTNVKDLFASVNNGIVTVWGRNASNRVFYTQCPVGQMGTSAQWSYPLAIMNGVENVSPFVNRANSSLTFFAHVGVNQLKIAVKSPGSGTWTQRNVTLPPADLKSAAKHFNTYTTRVLVTGSDNQPAANATVAISATNVTSVYINHLYYVVGPAPINVNTDPAGSVTIVEAISRLDATKFSVSVIDKLGAVLHDGGGNWINPMTESTTLTTRLQQLKTPNGLKLAQIKSQTPGSAPVKLVTRGSDTDLQDASDNITHLWQAHDELKSGKRTTALLSVEQHAARYLAFVGNATPIVVDAGDLMSMLDAQSAHAMASHAPGAMVQAGETWWEAIVSFLKGAWHFIVKTAEGFFSFIFKVVEEVFAAFKYVFNKIVEAIEDVIKFVKYLFELDDIRRTKDVFKNLMKRFLEYEVNEIQVVKAEFDGAVNDAIKLIDNWAGTGDLDKLGAYGTAKLNHRAEPAKGPTAPGALVAHHFQGNTANAGHQANAPAIPTLSSEVLAALQEAWGNAKRDLGKEFKELDELMQHAGSMSVVDLLKKLIGIIAGGVLRITKDVIDALFNVMYIVAKAMVELLDHPIYIPVVTEILALFGIPEFSLLDLLCWAVAIPFTIAYKIGLVLAGKPESAPFPDDKYTTFLASEKDFRVIMKAFQGTPHLALSGAVAGDAAGTAPRLGDGPDSPIMNDEQAKIVSISLHSAAGFFGFISAGLDFFEAVIPFKEVPSYLTYGSAGCAITGGLSRAVANVMVPRYPLANVNASACNRGVTFLFVMNKILWSGPVQNKLRNPVEDPRFFGGIADSLLVLFSIPWTIWHFAELGATPEGKKRTIAILDECSSVASYGARWIYSMLVYPVPKEPDTELALDVVMAVAQGVYGGFQFAEAFVEV